MEPNILSIIKNLRYAYQSNQLGVITQWVYKHFDNPQVLTYFGGIAVSSFYGILIKSLAESKSDEDFYKKYPSFVDILKKQKVDEIGKDLERSLSGQPESMQGNFRPQKSQMSLMSRPPQGSRVFAGSPERTRPPDTTPIALESAGIIAPSGGLPEIQKVQTRRFLQQLIDERTKNDNYERIQRQFIQDFYIEQRRERPLNPQEILKNMLAANDFRRADLKFFGHNLLRYQNMMPQEDSQSSEESSSSDSTNDFSSTDPSLDLVITRDTGKRIQNLEEEIAKYIDRIKELESILRERLGLLTAREIDQRIAELVKTEENYQKALTQINQLKQQLQLKTSVEGSSRVLEEKINSLKAEKEELNKTIANLQKAKHDGSDTIQTLRKFIAQLEEKITNIQQQNQANTDRRIAELQVKIDEAQTESARLKRLEEQIGNIANRLDPENTKKVRDSIDRLKIITAAYEASLKKMENDKQRLTDENDRLNKQLIAEQTKNQNMKEQMQKLEDEKKYLSTQVKKIQAEREQLQVKYDQLELAKSSATGEQKQLIEQQQKKILDLENKLKDADQAMRELDAKANRNYELAVQRAAKLNEYAGEIEQLQKQVADLNQKIQDVQKKSDQKVRILEMRLLQSDQGTEANRRTEENLLREKKACEEEKNRLRQEIAQIQQAIKNKDLELEDLRITMARKDTTIKELTDQIPVREALGQEKNIEYERKLRDQERIANDLRDTIQRLNKRILESDEECRLKVADLEEKLRQANLGRAENAQVKLDIYNIQQRCEDEKNKLRQQIALLDRELNDARNATFQLKRELQSAQTDNANKNRRIAELEQQLQQERQKVFQDADKISELETQLFFAQQEVDVLKTDNQALRAEIDLGRARMTQLERERGQMNNRIQELENQLRDEQNRSFTDESRMEQLREDLQFARAELVQLELDFTEERQRLQDVITNLEAETDKQIRQLAEVTESRDINVGLLRRSTALTSQLQRRVSNMGQEKLDLTQLLQQNVDLAAEYSEQIEELTAENEDLIAQLTAARAGAAAPVAAAPPVARAARAPRAAPNIFPANDMANVARGQDNLYVSQIDQFLEDLTVAINAAVEGGIPIAWGQQPLAEYPTVTSWENAQKWLRQRGMNDLGDITENPRQLKIFMDGQARRANVRTGLGRQLYDLKVLPLRFKLLTSEYAAGPATKTISNLPGKQRTVTSDLGTVVIPGQSNYTLRRQGLNYVVHSAGRSQTFASERDANYFVQTGGFGRKTYGPVTERIFGTPVKNISKAVY